jgi:hypothetical protein
MPIAKAALAAADQAVVDAKSATKSQRWNCVRHLCNLKQRQPASPSKRLCLGAVPLSRFLGQHGEVSGGLGTVSSASRLIAENIATVTSVTVAA